MGLAGHSAGLSNFCWRKERNDKIDKCSVSGACYTCSLSLLLSYLAEFWQVTQLAP